MSSSVPHTHTHNTPRYETVDTRSGTTGVKSTRGGEGPIYRWRQWSWIFYTQPWLHISYWNVLHWLNITYWNALHGLNSLYWNILTDWIFCTAISFTDWIRFSLLPLFSFSPVSLSIFWPTVPTFALLFIASLLLFLANHSRSRE